MKKKRREGGRKGGEKIAIRAIWEFHNSCYKVQMITNYFKAIYSGYLYF